MKEALEWLSVLVSVAAIGASTVTILGFVLPLRRRHEALEKKINGYLDGKGGADGPATGPGA